MIAAALALMVTVAGNPPAAVGVNRPPVSGTLGPVLPSDAPVHLGISLRVPSIDAMRTAAAAQQDPGSPTFRRWLTPSEVGKQFGLSDDDYQRVETWLVKAGFKVTAFEDHLFIEGFGTHDMVQKLLGIQLYSLSGADGHTYRTFQGTPQAPSDVAPLVLNVSGLDTQRRFRPLLLDTQGDRTFGPQDLRRFYDLQSLLDLGYTGRGASLVVLGVAGDSAHATRTDDIRFFFYNYADTPARFLTRALPNLNNDVDSSAAARSEMELDVEVQAISAPGAATITLELPPASEQLSTGAHDVAIQSNVTAVSTSFGTCEAAVSQDEAQSVEQLVLMGNMGGQTWVAAAGDRGADDCATGTFASVDLPADVPEIVAAGGTMVPHPAFDANDAVARYEPETTWNQQGVGAGGGGSSNLFPKPAWQVPMTPDDKSRDLPDVALYASTSPGVAFDADLPARTAPAGGTSVASPLAAGMFAVLSDRLGCRLGGVNPALYAVGLAQLDGGFAAFHDIAAGDNSFNGVPGASAVAGFDLATGWGSMDLRLLAAAFPPCAPDAGAVDAGPLVPYDSCTAIDCPSGSTCETTPEGPSYCLTPCDPLDAGSCGSGSLCVAADGGGRCVPGCRSDDDCLPGDACDFCTQTCQTFGSPLARVGDGCQSDSDCTAGGVCLTDGTFAGGYCTQFCDGCGCPSGSSCAALNLSVCLAQCLGNADCRAGYACQPLAMDAGPTGVCLPHCQSDDDCAELDPGTRCDLSSGSCGFAPPNDGGGEMDGGNETGGGPADAGSDGGVDANGDAGAADAGSPGEQSAPPGGETSGGVSPPPSPSGGCSQAGASDLSSLAFLVLGCLAARRKA